MQLEFGKAPFRSILRRHDWAEWSRTTIVTQRKKPRVLFEDTTGATFWREGGLLPIASPIRNTPIETSESRVIDFKSRAGGSILGGYIASICGMSTNSPSTAA